MLDLRLVSARATAVAGFIARANEYVRLAQEHLDAFARKVRK